MIFGDLEVNQLRDLTVYVAEIDRHVCGFWPPGVACFSSRAAR
jgi:hypothetical protein